MTQKGHRSPKKKKSGKDYGEELKRAEKVYRILTDLQRRLSPLPYPLEKRISFFLNPGDDAQAFARNLVESILSLQSDDRSGLPYVKGRLYCYNCASFVCSHSLPPNNLSVFAGYSPTGFPIWEEFGSVLLDDFDPRIDRLVQEKNPEILSLCQDGDKLKAEQLSVFGKDSNIYDIWGQVIVGYLPFPRDISQSRCAITIQIIRRLKDAKPNLTINLVGLLGNNLQLTDYLLMAPETELSGIISKAQKKLDLIQLKMRASGASLDHKKAAGPILRQIARGLEGVFRRRQRRTKHAAKRRDERPAVGLALKDLKKASKDCFLYDSLRKTYIVIGPKWRTHVFGSDGRHVTSMTHNRDSVQKRLDIKRWRYASKEERRLILSLAFGEAPL